MGPVSQLGFRSVTSKYKKFIWQLKLKNQKTSRENPDFQLLWKKLKRSGNTRPTFPHSCLAAMVAAERQLIHLDEATILTQSTMLIYFTCPTQVDI